ncbi:MAG: hypothetical protein K0V04_11300 [Deltaproteobacteria bacterium]|nr:hypothetical protein [Deltaproteobacteria bacterium]
MKLKTVKPEKYKELTKGELADQLVRRDVSEVRTSLEEQQQQGRVIRMGSAGIAALLTGIVYAKKPELESIMGTPVSLDHLVALGGTVAAFMIDDDEQANAAEGIGLAGLVPLLRDGGRKVGGMVG